MQLRHLRFFTTLARLRHFAKAASECGVSQPTLSAGLIALEQEFGKRLVERDRRFISLTIHGEAMLPWAQQILGAVGGMADAVATANSALEGNFRLAAIPAGLPIVGAFAEALLAKYPGLSLSVHTGTSRDIEHGLNVLEYDAGLTYLDHEPSSNVLSVPLYFERYLFMARRGTGFDEREAISWAEAAESRPFCLLHQGMQYRRILDAQMATRGLVVAPQVIADSYVTLLATVRTGVFVTILPDSYAALTAGLEWAKFLPFEGEEEARRIGLVVVNRSPLGPMANAGLSVARALGVLRLKPFL